MNGSLIILYLMSIPALVMTCDTRVDPCCNQHARKLRSILTSSLVVVCEYGWTASRLYSSLRPSFHRHAIHFWLKCNVFFSHLVHILTNGGCRKLRTYNVESLDYIVSVISCLFACLSQSSSLLQPRALLKEVYLFRDQ